MKKIQRKRTVKKLVLRQTCLFCQEKKEPDYKDVETLRSFLSERGKILAAARTGNCSKHQRKLTRAVKRARTVALLPFSARVQ